MAYGNVLCKNTAYHKCSFKRPLYCYKRDVGIRGTDLLLICISARCIYLPLTIICRLADAVPLSVGGMGFTHLKGVPRG